MFPRLQMCQLRVNCKSAIEYDMSHLAVRTFQGDRFDNQICILYVNILRKYLITILKRYNVYLFKHERHTIIFVYVSLLEYAYK